MRTEKIRLSRSISRASHGPQSPAPIKLAKRMAQNYVLLTPLPETRFRARYHGMLGADGGTRTRTPNGQKILSPLYGGSRTSPRAPNRLEIGCFHGLFLARTMPEHSV